MIQVDAVTKTHGTGALAVAALRGVTCEMPRGRFTFILGPSGSGKSTLLYLLGALDEPTSGRILVEGRSLQEMSARDRDQFRRNDAGFIFQNFNLISNLTALDNVMVPFLPAGTTPEQRKRAAELLDRVGLGSRLQHRPTQLSGGEQQRVAIARALLKRPKLVLADEPTGELDSANGQAVMDLLRRLSVEEHATVVVVTHERQWARPEDHLVRIRDGQVESQAHAPGDAAHGM